MFGDYIVVYVNDRITTDHTGGVSLKYMLIEPVTDIDLNENPVKVASIIPPSYTFFRSVASRGVVAIMGKGFPM